MELLRVWGLESGAAGARRRHARTAADRDLAHPGVPVHALVPFGYPTDEQVYAVSPTSPCYCPQDHLEPVLARYLETGGGQLRFHTELRGLRSDSAGVTVELIEHGQPSHVEVRYLIGADGPRSTVRSALGIGVEELGTLGDFLAVTFRADLTDRLPHVPSTINAVEIPGADGILVPTSADDRWIYAYQLQPGAPVNCGIEACTERVRIATGLPDLRPEILSVMQFEMGRTWRTRCAPVAGSWSATPRTAPHPRAGSG